MRRIKKWKLLFPLVIFVIIMVIGTSGCSNNSSKPKSNPSAGSNTTVANPPDWVHMFNEQNGYGGSSEYPVMVTSNGGTLWTDVTPQMSRNDPWASTTGYFVNAETGLTFRLQPEKSVIVYGTRNGGQSWSQLAIVPVKYGDGGMFIVFSDARHGWFEEITAGHAQLDSELFATSTGGETWHLVAASEQGSLPFVGSLSAQEDGTLWLSGVGILKSTNGGKTWSQVNLPLSADHKKETTSISKPVFFGNSGFVTVLFRGGEWVLYATQDGGQTWSVRSTLPVAVRGAGVVYDFISSQQGWAINNGNDLESSNKVSYVTQDGGRSWQEILPNNYLKNRYVREIDFVNSKDGWMLYNQSTETGVKSFIAKTTNGGMSWDNIEARVDVLR